MNIKPTSHPRAYYTTATLKHRMEKDLWAGGWEVEKEQGKGLRTLTEKERAKV